MANATANNIGATRYTSTNTSDHDPVITEIAASYIRACPSSSSSNDGSVSPLFVLSMKKKTKSGAVRSSRLFYASILSIVSVMVLLLTSLTKSNDLITEDRQNPILYPSLFEYLEEQRQQQQQQQQQQFFVKEHATLADQRQHSTPKRKTTIRYDASQEIPHRLIFTFKYNMLVTKEPALVYQNVLHTIRVYNDFWNISSTRDDDNDKNDSIPENVWFLDNDDCHAVLEEVFPDLVQDFLAEPSGRYKGDICRLAALMKTGGYYFDVDMRTLRPLALPAAIRFSSVKMTAPRRDTGIFQSFIASTPGHPILNDTMLLTAEFYRNKKEILQAGEKWKDNIQPWITNSKISFNAERWNKTKHELLDFFHDRFSQFSERNDNKILDYRGYALNIIESKKKSFLKTQQNQKGKPVVPVESWEEQEPKVVLILLDGISKQFDNAFLGKAVNLLGPRTMQLAYDRLSEEHQQRVYFLEERNLAKSDDKRMYPALPRQKGVGCCCQWIVHDPTEWSNSSVSSDNSSKSLIPYFFSRMVGATKHCRLRKNKENNKVTDEPIKMVAGLPVVPQV